MDSQKTLWALSSGLCWCHWRSKGTQQEKHLASSVQQCRGAKWASKVRCKVSWGAGGGVMVVKMTKVSNDLTNAMGYLSWACLLFFRAKCLPTLFCKGHNEYVKYLCSISGAAGKEAFNMSLIFYPPTQATVPKFSLDSSSVAPRTCLQLRAPESMLPQTP